MAAELSDPTENEDRQIISTGNSELDKKIADGLPMGSLTLIEGENDTGKSVLTQQIIWGATETGNVRRSVYYGKHQQELYQADGIDEP